ncbi:TBC1 domain family member 4 [Plakobranchus ocellatus]|uniref:TBC1 domain family member 4 n=1 Tax=Plakobranchus ocellatus TaxID=259542 RepID=A0AAV4AXQ8_9GAST|nr:TBC1 domain family member 4 [Plakobranchus ocellatus]
MADKNPCSKDVMAPAIPPKFSVRYLGSRTMNSLYSQTMQPWVMAEMRRKKTGSYEVVIEIVKETLTVQSASPESEESPVQLDHHLKGLTRFAKLHQDPCCFAYLTRYQPNADFECHVYLANAEELIPEIFKAIREASKGILTKALGNSQSTDDAGSEQTPQPVEEETHEQLDAGNSLFEVKYLGHAKVGSKRVTSDLIDSLAETMISLEEDHVMRILEQRERHRMRRRKHHSSGASTDSLPEHVLSHATTDSKVKDETCLNVGKDSVSPLGHSLDATTRRRHFSHQDIPVNRATGLSSENLVATSSPRSGSFSEVSAQAGHYDRQRRASGDSAHFKESHLNRARHPSSDSQDQDEHNAVVMSGRAENQSGLGSGTGIALLHIGQHDLSLLSLDTKANIMESKFSDISFVSQGNHKQDVFGIIVRGTGSTFICYILKCLNDSVVSEVMSTLQAAFTSAYNKSGSHDVGGQSVGRGGGAGGGASQHPVSPQSCPSCPLHQLHRLCQEIHALSSQAAHDLLLKKVHSLPEKDINEIRRKVQDEAPESFEESVEVLMICLHQMCERRQREHVHVSDTAVKVPKLELGLNEEKHTLFEGLRNKARKSLTTSFENLLSRVSQQVFVCWVLQFLSLYCPQFIWQKLCGPIGPARIQGITGATELIGPARPQGITGATELIGLARPQGITGATELIGPARPQGITGATELIGLARSQSITESTELIGLIKSQGITGATELIGLGRFQGITGATEFIGPARPQGGGGVTHLVGQLTTKPEV